jgi:hypothetical protein
MSHFGFSILPLVNEWQSRLYFMSGLFQVPILEGEPPQKLIEMLLQDPNRPPLESLKKFKQRVKNIDYLYGNPSLIIRVIDAQRSAHFIEPLEQLEPSKRWIE